MSAAPSRPGTVERVAPRRDVRKEGHWEPRRLRTRCPGRSGTRVRPAPQLVAAAPVVVFMEGVHVHAHLHAAGALVGESLQRPRRGLESGDVGALGHRLATGARAHVDSHVQHARVTIFKGRGDGKELTRSFVAPREPAEVSGPPQFRQD